MPIINKKPLLLTVMVFRLTGYQRSSISMTLDLITSNVYLRLRGMPSFSIWVIATSVPLTSCAHLSKCWQLLLSSVNIVILPRCSSGLEASRYSVTKLRKVRTSITFPITVSFDISNKDNRVLGTGF